MNESQQHFGLKFYKDHKTGYWISCKCPKVRAHRWVWQNVNGKIPEGCHIHHKDEDKSNNDISNLCLMPRQAHLSLHMTKEKREWASKRMEEIRPLTKEWHSSGEGRAWHKYHALKNKFGKNEPRQVECAQCRKKYETTKLSRSYFCSNPCKSKNRRDSGVDDIVKICLACKNEFKCNKYAKMIYCSRICAQAMRKV